MRSVIFDLDGTLADTSGDLLDAANACFRALGLDNLLIHPADAPTALRGGRAMLRLGFSRVEGYGEDDVDRQYQPLLDAYSGNLSGQTRLYPGAIAAVEALRTAGHPVGICTNKPEGLADALMRELGVRDLFGSLIGADTLPVRKPDPRALIEAVTRAGGDPALACLVGDTETDHMTARNAGVPSILVTFGPGQSEAAALSPDALLHDFADLPGLIAALDVPRDRSA